MRQTFGVDIGNSGIRISELLLPSRELGTMLRIDWWPNDEPSPRFSSETRRFCPDDPQWLCELDNFIDSNERPTSIDGQPPRWLISSVRRDALDLLRKHMPTGNTFNPHATRRQVDVITYSDLPLDIQVDFPQAVGIDRLLAALAALEFIHATPAIVIQAGSAVTVDIIHAPANNDGTLPTLGSFDGGAILPGVPMMLQLLGKAADQLPHINADDLLSLPDLPGKHTEAAMICGTASALVGGVSHLVERYRQQYGQSVPIIISGGDGMRLSPYLSPPLIIKDHLVHRGLMRLAEQMQPDPPE